MTRYVSEVLVLIQRQQIFQQPYLRSDFFYLIGEELAQDAVLSRGSPILDRKSVV